jgi:hypothetical protein
MGLMPTGPLIYCSRPATARNHGNCQLLCMLLYIRQLPAPAPPVSTHLLGEESQQDQCFQEIAYGSAGAAVMHQATATDDDAWLVPQASTCTAQHGAASCECQGSYKTIQSMPACLTQGLVQAPCQLWLDPDQLLPPRPLAPALPLLLLELNNTSLSVSTPTRTQAGCSRAPLLF